MNSLQKILAIGSLPLVLAGCEVKLEYLTGEVLKESGSITQIIPSRGALFGNESVKFGNDNYILTIGTNAGNYVLEVGPFYRGDKSLIALAEMIEQGDSVRVCLNCDRDRISNDRVGYVRTNSVEVLKKK